MEKETDEVGLNIKSDSGSGWTLVSGDTDGVPCLHIGLNGDKRGVHLDLKGLRELQKWAAEEAERLDRLEPFLLADGDGDTLSASIVYAGVRVDVRDAGIDVDFQFAAEHARQLGAWLLEAADKLDAREKAK